MDPLSLETRPGLPDALRVLAERYPRDGWETHPDFNALTRFWLDRHLMFREVQGQLIRRTEILLDRNANPARSAADLSRLAGFFLTELHTHHHIEDDHYFPALAAQDARLSAAFALLDRDHTALDTGMRALATGANAVLAEVRTASNDLRPAGALKETLDRFARLLDRHLVDEEEIVVPIILEYHGAGMG